MKCFLLICLVCFAGIAGAQNREIKFEELGFKEAIAKAKAENKLLFFDAYTSWCGPCKQMAKDVFTRDEVADFFNASFVNIKMDMEKGEGPEIVEKYGIAVYPTFLLVNGDGQEVFRTVGASDVPTFLAKIKSGMKPENSIAFLDEQYKKGERSYEFIEKYLNLLHKAYLIGREKAVVESYFKDMSVKEICSEKNWVLFDKYVKTIGIAPMQRMVKQASAFKSALGKEKAETKLCDVYQSALFNFLLRSEEITDEQYKSYGQDIKRMKLPEDKKGMLETFCRLAYFKAHRMYADYLKICEEDNQYLSEMQKENLVVTLTFFADAEPEMKSRALQILYKQVQKARSSEEGLTPQMDQVYGYVYFKLKGEPGKEQK